MDETLPDEIVSQTINLMRVESGMRQKALAVIEDMEDDLTRQISKAPDVPVNYGSRRNAMLKMAKATIATAYGDITDQQEKDLRGVAKVQGKATVQAMNKAIGVPILTVTVPPTTLEAVVDAPTVLGFPARSWWASQSTELQRKYIGVIQQGVLQGKTNEQIIRAVRGTQANNYKDGIMEVTRNNADALVRTSVMSVANAASMKTIENMGDVVKGIQWVSTLDSRTTLQCISLSGAAWTLDDKTPIRGDKNWPGLPPIHFRCRSRIIPLMKSWEELGSKPLPSLGDETPEKRLEKAVIVAQGDDPKKVAAAEKEARATAQKELEEEAKKKAVAEAEAKAKTAAGKPAKGNASETGGGKPSGTQNDPAEMSWEELGVKLPKLDPDAVERRMRKILLDEGMDPAKVEKAKANVRASMDGQVPETLTFDDWFARKDDEFVDRHLGPRRSEMIRGGLITTKQLTSQDNRPLTVKQLADLIEEGTPLPETLGLNLGRTDIPTRLRIVEATAADAAATRELKKALEDPEQKETVSAVIDANPDKSPSAQAALVEVAKRQAAMNTAAETALGVRLGEDQAWRAAFKAVTGRTLPADATAEAITRAITAALDDSTESVVVLLARVETLAEMGNP